MSEKIIQGSFGPKAPKPPLGQPVVQGVDMGAPGGDYSPPPVIMTVGPDGQPVPVLLSEDQNKAIALALSGKTFVMVAITPTESGADFHTAIHGEASDLRNAQDELPNVISRAFGRKGI